ncbi:efflux RND transporter periplasmic adaptor subunit [bacterium]|nr:efflux RND transporter periplasmic adaptor subunit [bacterium]
MRSKKKKIIIIVIILLVVVVGGGAIYQSQQKKDVAISVTVEEAAVRRIVATVSAIGKIEPVTQVKLSAEIPGRIVQLPVKEGQYVDEGDFLVELDPELYISNLDAAKSALRSARAAKQKADADLRRISELVAKGMASEADLDAAQANAELTAADLDRAEANERNARENLAKTRLHASMTGTISLLNKEIGELTLGSQFQEDVILVIADLSKMQVRAEVDEHDIVSVKLGDSSFVEIDAFPDTQFVGIVTEIAESASNVGTGNSLVGEAAATNFDVLVSIVDSIKGIRPGMSATVDIATDYRNSAISVSIQSVAIRDAKKGEAVELKAKEKSQSSREIEAQVKSGTLDTTSLLTRQELESGVFLYKEGKAEWMPVRAGIASERYMEIIEGIAEGDSVINGPYRVLARDLKDGDAVKLKEEKKEGEKQKEDEEETED